MQRATTVQALVRAQRRQAHPIGQLPSCDLPHARHNVLILSTDDGICPASCHTFFAWRQFVLCILIAQCLT